MGLGDKRVGNECPPYQTDVARIRPRVPVARNKTGRGLSLLVLRFQAALDVVEQGCDALP